MSRPKKNDAGDAFFKKPFLVSADTKGVNKASWQELISAYRLTEDPVRTEVLASAITEELFSNGALDSPKSVYLSSQKPALGPLKWDRLMLGVRFAQRDQFEKTFPTAKRERDTSELHRLLERYRTVGDGPESGRLVDRITSLIFQDKEFDLWEVATVSLALHSLGPVEAALLKGKVEATEAGQLSEAFLRRSPRIQNACKLPTEDFSWAAGMRKILWAEVQDDAQWAVQSYYGLGQVLGNADLVTWVDYYKQSLRESFQRDSTIWLPRANLGFESPDFFIRGAFTFTMVEMCREVGLPIPGSSR